MTIMEKSHEPVLHCTDLYRTSANYRGESAENRAVIQKITRGRFEYPIISPEAIRNALRETLAAMDMPCNRQRLHDEEQLAVTFKHYPNADAYVDDFFMGWLIATKNRGKEKENLIMDHTDPRGQKIRSQLEDVDKVFMKKKEQLEEKVKLLDDDDGEKKKKIKNELEKLKKKLDAQKKKLINSLPMDFKRDAVFRSNLAVALEPYRHDTVFTQSPQNVDSPWENAKNSQLLHREVTFTPFQYPFALNLNECNQQQEWTKKLLEAIGQLNGVAGNHARSYFEMAPASIVLRLTPSLVAGYNTYGFTIDEKSNHHQYPEVVEGILLNDYPGKEFFLGGKLVKDMDEGLKNELEGKGVTLKRNAQKLLAKVGSTMFAEK